MTNKTIEPYGDYIHQPNNHDLEMIPGDRGIPVMGHSLRFYADPFKFSEQRYRQYGPISRLNVLSGEGVLALGPDLMQQFFLDQSKNFSSKMGFADRVATFFSGSLIMEDFGHHKHQRRIMQTAFKSESLRDYTDHINGIYERAMTDWSADQGKTIPFFLYIKNLLLEVAAEIFIGESARDERAEKMNQAFIDCVNGTMYFLPWRVPGFAYHKGINGKEYLQKTIGELVPKKRAGDGKDMLSHFCREKDEDGNFFSDEEIANQTIFLLFAAHDTTTAAITHTIYFLARYPKVLAKLKAECDAIGKDALDYDDLDKVSYMQQVFFEVQRIRPSVPLVPRRAIRDVEMGGLTVPAHTMVYAVPRFSHNMPEYWDKPEEFDPDRFSPERAEHKQHPFLFHPFGGGAHKCIGMHFSQMEYKCFLYQFLRTYDFEARHKKEPAMMSLPLPKPDDGMPVELRRR